jgi:hypothetical protein
MSAILNFVRGIVSAKKFRFKEDGFDLDLTYITPRILGTNTESLVGFFCFVGETLFVREC